MNNNKKKKVELLYTALLARFILVVEGHIFAILTFHDYVITFEY